MNPVFFILLLLAACLLWLLLAKLFPFFGMVGKRLWNNAKDNMNKDEKETNEND